jgi:hypothetical protein
MIRRELVDTTVRDRLAAVTGKNIGLVSPPADLGLPYAVLYPLVSGEGDGQTWGDKEEWRDLNYQVTSVGSDVRQANWMNDRVSAFFVSKLPGGDYTNDITPAGMTVAWRVTRLLGMAEPTGPNLFQCISTFSIRVHKTPS